MGYFLDKGGKIAAVLGIHTQTPIGLRRLELPLSCYFHQLLQFFEACL